MKGEPRPNAKPSALEKIDTLLARGMAPDQIAAVLGRDPAYIANRARFLRSAAHSSPRLIDPERDEEFVRQVKAEGKRMHYRGHRGFAGYA